MKGGLRYDGEFNNGEIHGFGVFDTPQGHNYQGEF